MKEIKAIIRTHRLDAVLEALHAHPNLPGVTVSTVRGFGRTVGRSNGDAPMQYGTTEMAKLECVVDDEAVDAVIELVQQAAHKANWEMRLLERDLLRDLLAEHDSSGAYIAIDGGLGKEFKLNEFNRGFVGVIKNFSKEQVFELSSRGRTIRKSLFEMLASLRVNQRTAVFGRGEGYVVFWYLRIRPQSYLEYPMMGVMKIEYPNPTRARVDTDLIDHLSRALVAERTVTPHGKDRRWHAHLYPIFLAEQVIKNGFYSDEVLQAGIKWPGLERRTAQR